MWDGWSRKVVGNIMPKIAQVQVDRHYQTISFHVYELEASELSNQAPGLMLAPIHVRLGV